MRGARALRIARRGPRKVSLALNGITRRVGADLHIAQTSVELASEGFNVLLGTTLAGKTTLMQLMAGLLRPTSGTVHFGGRDVTGVAVQRRNVAMVYQQFINYPNMSVFENIASPLRVAGVSRGEIRRRVGTIAELLQLSHLLERRPAELSGGQQQRTAMARALVKDADLVLLDEPLANLDYKLREGLRDELPRLFAGRDCTVVYATTEPTEALLLGGHVATLHEGQITQFGPAAEVYRRPRDLRTAQVFSDPPMNTARVTKQGGRVRLGEFAAWRLPAGYASMPDGEYTFALRPHHVLPASIVADGAQRVRVGGRVLIGEISGSESVAHFELGGQTWVSLAHGVHRLAVGEPAQFDLDVVHGLYFDADDRLVANAGPAHGG